jgi:hypothetical protein
MLSPKLEDELRTEFANAGSRIQAPDDLTECLLRKDYRPRGRARFLVPLLVCSIVVLTLGGVLVSINLSGREPADASVLASEFSVFNRPASPSDALPSNFPLTDSLPASAQNKKLTGARLLASKPGYGIEKVYAATYPNATCLFVQRAPESGGDSGGCSPPRVLETSHAMFQWSSGSARAFLIGFVANDVTNVKVNGVVAPVSGNDFFLTPLPDEGNGPLNVTINLSDGRSITEISLPVPPPRPGDSHS